MEPTTIEKQKHTKMNWMRTLAHYALGHW